MCGTGARLTRADDALLCARRHSFSDKSGDLDHEEFREFFENLGFGSTCSATIIALPNRFLTQPLWLTTDSEPV